MLTTISIMIGGIATIVGAVYGFFKYIAWQLQETPEEAKEKIDKKVQNEFEEVKRTGRPTE